MIKGTTRIQLFDKNTGECVRDVHSDNMATNALQNLCTIDPRLLMGYLVEQYCIRDTYDTFSPLTDEVFSATDPLSPLTCGLMIFSDTLEEDVDHIIPSPSERDSLVGYGGRCAALDGNTMRGTFNGTRSSILPTGFTYVWDFTSEQVNGEISSLALTSSWGGEQAWNASQYEWCKTFIPFGDENANAESGPPGSRLIPNSGVTAIRARTMSDATNSNTRFFSNGYLIWVGMYSDRQTIVTRAKKYNRTVSLGTKLDFDDWSVGTYVETTLTMTEPFASPYPRIIEGDGYAAYAHPIASAESTSRLVEITCNASGVCSMVERTINTQDALETSTNTHTRTMAIVGDYVYTKTSVVDNYIIKSNKLTGVTETVTLPEGIDSSDVVDIVNNLDTVWIKCADNMLYYLNVQGTWTKMEPNSNTNFYYLPRLYSGVLKEPWYLATITFSGALYAMLLSPYLATINNISSPVIKTSEMTMRVTYTITTL